jgi:hypothetical protein
MYLEIMEMSDCKAVTSRKQIKLLLALGWIILFEMIVSKSL